MNRAGLPWLEGSIAHNTAWAQNTRIVPVVKVLVQMYALGVVARTAFLAFFVDGALPGVVKAGVEKLGVDPAVVTGKGAPLMWKMNEVLGIDVTAGTLGGLFALVVGFLFLRLRMVERLRDAVRPPASSTAAAGVSVA